MSVYQKTMFDRYYCIVILSLEKFGKTLFVLPIMARKSMKDSYILKRLVPEQSH